MRIGLAGLGPRGLWWLHLLQKLPGCRLVALCDRIAALHEKGLAALANRRGVKLYTDCNKFLADKNVDAVALTVR